MWEKSIWLPKEKLITQHVILIFYTTVLKKIVSTCFTFCPRLSVWFNFYIVLIIWSGLQSTNILKRDIVFCLFSHRNIYQASSSCIWKKNKSSCALKALCKWKYTSSLTCSTYLFGMLNSWWRKTHKSPLLFEGQSNLVSVNTNGNLLPIEQLFSPSLTNCFSKYSYESLRGSFSEIDFVIFAIK